MKWYLVVVVVVMGVVCLDWGVHGQVVIDGSQSVEEAGRMRFHQARSNPFGFYGRWAMAHQNTEDLTGFRYKRSTATADAPSEKVDAERGAGAEKPHVNQNY